MTVAELIAELQKVEPQSTVRVLNSTDGLTYEPTVVEHEEDDMASYRYNEAGVTWITVEDDGL